VICRQAHLVPEGSDVARFTGYTVVETGLVGMPCIENHDSFIGQYQEGGVIVIIGLEPGADQYLTPPVMQMIDLYGLDIALHIDITDIGTVDSAALIFIV
jgi:hypothetical protein